MNWRVVALVGPRGAGKSEVGRVLAAELGCAFVDADEALAEAVGRPAGEHLDAVGEERFRAVEEQVTVPCLEADGQAVVALGGGAVLSPRIRGRLIRSDVFTVFLFAPPDVLLERMAASSVHRPALTGLPPAQEVQRLLEARIRRYQQVADATFDTAVQPPIEVAMALVAHLST